MISSTVVFVSRARFVSGWRCDHTHLVNADAVVARPQYRLFKNLPQAPTGQTHPRPPSEPTPKERLSSTSRSPA